MQTSAATARSRCELPGQSTCLRITAKVALSAANMCSTRRDGSVMVPLRVDLAKGDLKEVLLGKTRAGR